MITTTLDAMAAGGIHDQLGGGFARYSTDDIWLVPHFEKMLYDNACSRARTCTATSSPASRATGASSKTSSATCCATCADPDGGFYSAEDADSEGVEGKFYCWSLDEIREVCGDDADEVDRATTASPSGGNFVDPHTGLPRQHPARRRPQRRAPAAGRARAAASARRGAPSACVPGLDDKVLLGWNALMLGALTEAAAALDRDDWMDAARDQRALPARELRRDDGRLPALVAGAPVPRVRRGLRRAARGAAHAGRARRRRVARRGARRRRRAAPPLPRPRRRRVLHDRHDAEALVVRPKDVFDDATPSANSLAANGLLRLAALTGENALRSSRALEVLEMLAPPVAGAPDRRSATCSARSNAA